MYCTRCLIEYLIESIEKREILVPQRFEKLILRKLRSIKDDNRCFTTFSAFKRYIWKDVMPVSELTLRMMGFGRLIRRITHHLEQYQPPTEKSHKHTSKIVVRYRFY